MSDETAVEVWCAVPPDTEGFPSSQPWEQLFAFRRPDGFFRIENVPFFARDIANGDIVSVRQETDGRFCVDRVVSRSGHSVFRIWLAAEDFSSAANIMETLGAFGCATEVTLGRLVAVDVPSPVEPDVWAFLSAGRERGDWDLQVGYSPE